MAQFQFKMAASKLLPLLLLLITLATPQPACYVSCSKQGCLPTNALSCTRCDTSSILINNRCAISGSQSEPIRVLAPNGLNVLDTSLLPAEDAAKPQVRCTSTNPGQSGVIAYLNVTRTKAQVYTYRIPQIFIKSPHQFVTIKFNAILFNPKPNPTIKALAIDQNDKRIYDSQIRANQSTFSCTGAGATGSQPAGNGFHVVINLPTQTQSLLFQISTVEAGDQLGLANLEIYYGNCDIGCAACEGPGPNQCLSCSNLLAYNANTKSCGNCPLRFYKVNSLCYPCPYNCQTCSMNTVTGVPECTKCEQGVSPNGQVPLCLSQNYVSQELKSVRFNDSQGWQSTAVLSNLYSVCGSYSLVGGIPSGMGGSSIFKTFTNLPVHSKMWIKFTLFLIDQVTGSAYRAFIDVDGIRVNNFSANIDASIMNTSQCGTQRQQYVSTVMIPDIAHSSPNATVSVLGLANYFGIRDFVIGVVNVTQVSGCAQVDQQNRCIRCKNGFSLILPVGTNGTQCSSCPDGTYEKNGTCTQCPIYCRSCELSNNVTKCTSCDLPLKFDPTTASCNDENNNLYTVALSQGWGNQTSQNWDLYPKLQNKGIDFCGGNQILGSTQLRYRELNMKKVFANLPNHQGVSVHLFFYQIDDYDGPINGKNSHSVFFKLGNSVIPYVPSTVGTNICGNGSFDSIQKLVLNDAIHQGDTLTLQIHGNRTKMGVSNVLLFLTNCQECKDNGISYQLETIPVYSVQTDQTFIDRGLKSKLIFNQPIKANTDLKNLFHIRLVNRTADMVVGQTESNSTVKARGERDPYQILTAELYANRELRMLQNLIRDQYNKTAAANLLAPDLAYGFIPNAAGSDNIIKNLRLKPVYAEFSRFDELHSDSSGAGYRANTRNLMNLFRGISILALFIGLISFLFGLSDLFDDLFVMCQIIFVHIFIQSPWISATMKLPVGAMNLVQFMAWLPLEARNGIEKAIIPDNHYQRSPIVYEQYWKDITFARAIYHVVIFLAIMFVLYWIISLIKQLRKPSLSNVFDINTRKSRFVQNFYYNYVKHWFVYLDRIVRFTFFTVMWSACLQFIVFKNQPGSFMGWNSALCIFMFVVYIAYAFLGYFYLRNQAQITQDATFKQKFDGIRLKKGSLWYFVFKYMKWLAIAFLIGQLYKANPLIPLIILMVIHVLDALILIFWNPYIEHSGQSSVIVSKCSKIFWFFYRISHIIQNFLFFILQLIMIIMYGVRSYAGKDSYLSIGYACCAFIIMMFINALVRLVWGFVRKFEICADDVKGRDQEIKSEEEIDPLKFLDLYKANQNEQQNTVINDYHGNKSKRPSIEGKL